MKAQDAVFEKTICFNLTDRIMYHGTWKVILKHGFRKSNSEPCAYKLSIALSEAMPRLTINFNQIKNFMQQKAL